MPRDPKHEPHFEANRAWWDGVVPIHEASRGYDREGFLRGEKPLCPVEAAKVLAWLARPDFGQPPVADVREG